MAKYFIEDTTLTGIADAIREKDGTAEAISVADYADRIGAIDTQEDLDSEMAAQDDLIARLLTALDGKSVPKAKKTVSVTVNSVVAVYYMTVDNVFKTVENGTVEAVGGFLEIRSLGYGFEATGQYKTADATSRRCYIFSEDGGTLTVTNTNDQ